MNAHLKVQEFKFFPRLSQVNWNVMQALAAFLSINELVLVRLVE